MIWILLLYVLPFLLSCGLGYKLSKESGETKGQFLLGVLVMLVPFLNIVYMNVAIIGLLLESKTIESIKEYLKQPL
jgi:uncharacterized membrane protein